MSTTLNIHFEDSLDVPSVETDTPFQFAAIFQVDFQLLNEKGETSSFIANGEWALLGKIYSLYNLNAVIRNLSRKYLHPLITQTKNREQFPFFLCTHKCS